MSLPVAIEEVLALASFALAAIRKIADNQAIKTAAEMAEAIRAVYGAVSDAAVGKVAPEVAKASIEKLVADLRANDAAADAALDAKFPPAPPPEE